MKDAVARILLILTMLVAFAACSSCVSMSQFFGEGNLFRSKRRSFVKINTLTNIAIIRTSSTTPDKVVEDYRLEMSSTASGVIMGHYNDITLIATSAHVCSMRFGRQINHFVPHYREGDPNWHFMERPFFVLKDLNGKTFVGIVIKLDYSSDLCMMVSRKISMPEIKISRHEPMIGEKYYNIAAPKGIWGKKVVPLLEGRFLGHVASPFTGDPSYMFSIPASGGSSGSPVVNIYGDLVGLIHSAYGSFEHISMAATNKQLEKLLSSSYMKLQKQYKNYKVILSLHI
jgi:S1-C subfamily serine protease